MKQIIITLDNVTYTLDVADEIAINSIGSVIQYHVQCGRLIPVSKTTQSSPTEKAPAKHRTPRTVRKDSAENQHRIKVEQDAQYAPLQGAGTEKQKIAASDTMTQKDDTVRKDEAEKKAKSKTSSKSSKKVADRKAQDNTPQLNNVVVKLNLDDHGISISYADGSFIRDWAVRKVANGMLKDAGLKWDNDHKVWSKSRTFDIKLVELNPDGIIVAGENVKALKAEYEEWKAAHPNYVSKKNRKSSK